MKIRCHTNLDLHHCERFPEELPCRPMKGDIITSSTGLELAVVGIGFRATRSIQNPMWSDWKATEVTETICNVELHLPPHRFENITTFEKWYNARRL